ncbi:hypothetical protein SCOCK_10109 [Actinacidiphila cocklensis]|uniref:Uncharacterized protein n=1 Tax=Actinacidiphila cocklensis TaxID=887465 RepID=A0A9W4GMU9_9ACTN|nr:hypothetical protein SCOCK_10109 [Actinacidiphila cocklensis]
MSYVDLLEDVRIRLDVVGELGDHAVELRAAERRGEGLGRLPDRDVHHKPAVRRALVQLQGDESRLSHHELRLPAEEGPELFSPLLRNDEGVGHDDAPGLLLELREHRRIRVETLQLDHFRNFLSLSVNGCRWVSRPADTSGVPVCWRSGPGCGRTWRCRTSARGRAVTADDRAGEPVGSREGGDQQGEGADDDGDTDVVPALPAVQLLLPVLGPVLGGPRLVPVVDRNEQQKRHDHADGQKRAGGDDEAGAVVVPPGDSPGTDEDERADVPERHHGAEHPTPVGVAELATVLREGIEDRVHDEGDGELHPHHHADDHGGDDLERVEHDDPFWYLASLADEATLALLSLSCLALLGSNHVGTGTQGTRTGGARAPHRGDGPRTRRAAGLGRRHHPPARRTDRIQPARPLQPLPRQARDHRRCRPPGRHRNGRGGAGRDRRRGRPARPGVRPRPRLSRLRRTQPGGLRRPLPARRRSRVRAGGHPGTSQGRLRRAAGVPRRGHWGRRRPGTVHRGVLGVPARGGDPDPVATAAAGGHRTEGETAGGPARRGLTPTYLGTANDLTCANGISAGAAPEGGGA